MSNKSTNKKSKTKALGSGPSESLVSNFIDKTDDSEPIAKKLKKSSSVEQDPDDSLKFFKPKTRSSKQVPQPAASTSSANLATNFINESSKKAVSKPRAKPTKVTKRKTKTQPDIRKVLSKQEQIFQHLVSENCLVEGTDPEEMQLALAISESLKDATQPSASKTAPDFENPFTSLGKVQPISAMLERFGFKSKKTYTEYELDLITNSKIAKRSKFQKFPTALTRTPNDKRNKIIRLKIDKILELSQMRELEAEESSKHNYEVFSFYLQELQEKLVTVFDMNSESRPTEEVLLNYYITKLFDPSFVKAGHLLKDWSQIPGRDLSPERGLEAKAPLTSDAKLNESVQKDESTRHETPAKEETTADAYKDCSTTSSCKDIFADIDDEYSDESFGETTQNTVKETSGELAAHLSKLQDKLSQTTEIDDVTEEANCDATIENLNCSSHGSNDSVVVEVIDNEMNDQIERLEREILEKTDEPEPEEAENIDLTQLESSTESVATIPYDDSYYSLQQHMMEFGHTSDTLETAAAATSPVNINLVSSDEDGGAESSESAEEDGKVAADVESDRQNDSLDNLFLDEEELNPMLSQNSFTDEDDVIAISDEEINYSVRKYLNNNEDPSDASTSSVNNAEAEAIDLTQVVENDEEMVGSQIEVINQADQSLFDILNEDKSCNINDTILDILDSSSGKLSTNKDRSSKVLRTDRLSDSLLEIMRKYGGSEEGKENSRVFKKMRSESIIGNESKRQSFRASLGHDDDEDVVDLTQPMEVNESFTQLNNTIHQSIENILDFSPIAPRQHAKRLSKAKKNLGVQLDDNYLVDTETFVPEPDFKNMTPVELKQELFKYGVRPLPVKKAIELLEFIYDQIHPKIRVAADEEIDINDSRRVMNITDIVTDIGVQDADDFVFQPGLVEDEDYVLPKMRKSKTSTCAIPLHISFYNMVRSNEKLQKFILEFRPVELDQIHKHFRKFGLSYQPNDIIAFMDKRCITFKTKEKSYSKTHEQKKQKRAQKWQKPSKSQK